MNTDVKNKILWISAITSGVLSLVLLAGGVYLVYIGVYPPDGNSSLGHVGIIVVGAVSIFLSVVADLFVVYFISKARKNTRVYTSSNL